MVPFWVGARPGDRALLVVGGVRRGFVSMARAGDGGEFEGGGIGSFTDETEVAGVGDDGVVVLVGAVAQQDR